MPPPLVLVSVWRWVGGSTSLQPHKPVPYPAPDAHEGNHLCLTGAASGQVEREEGPACYGLWDWYGRGLQMTQESHGHTGTHTLVRQTQQPHASRSRRPRGAQQRTETSVKKRGVCLVPGSLVWQTEYKRELETFSGHSAHVVSVVLVTALKFQFFCCYFHILENMK